MFLTVPTVQSYVPTLQSTFVKLHLLDHHLEDRLPFLVLVGTLICFAYSRRVSERTVSKTERLSVEGRAGLMTGKT